MIEIRTFRDLLRLFFIFYKEFKLAVISTLAVVLLGAFLLPTSFESTARLLIKPGRDTSTLPIEMADRQAIVTPGAIRDPILDEESILTGRPISRMVAERYLEELANAPEPDGFWASIKHGVGKIANSLVELARGFVQLLGLTEKQTPVERLASKLEDSFSVSHAAGSTVMDISFRWGNPAVAQAITQSWIKIYMQERTRTLGQESLYDFYQQQTDTSQAQILEYEQQVTRHLNDLGAVSMEDYLQDLAERINQLRTDAFYTSRLISSTESSLATLRLQIKKLPNEVVTVRELSLNPAHQNIVRMLNDKRAERLDLLRTFTEQAPPVVSIDQNIVELEKLASTAKATVQSSENLAPNPISERLRSNLMDQQSDLSRLKAQLSRQSGQLKKLEKQRAQALAIEPEVARLQRALTAAEKNFSLYSENLEKARIDRELDKNRISNISIIEHATLNPIRVFPKSLTMVFLSIPFSILVGLLVLYICYLIDQRIHDGGHIEDRFSIPLWTTLPEIQNGSPNQNSSFIASLYRLYGLLPLEQIEKSGLILGLTAARPKEGVSFIIEHLAQLLTERGHKVRVGGDAASLPGELVLLDASALLSNTEAFMHLHQADMIALVVEANKSTVPTVEHAVGVLTTAFGKVDGIIINRRRFEVPVRVLRIFSV